MNAEQSGISESHSIIGETDKILVTGAGGFLGSYVVRHLLESGYKNIRCLARSSSSMENLRQITAKHGNSGVEIIQGDLLSRALCSIATENVKVVYHLAAGADGKSFAGSFMKSVITTRNLIESTMGNESLMRFVNVGSFASYSNVNLKPLALMDETCPLHPASSPDIAPYTFAKIEQDNLVMSYGNKKGLPWVIIRPGAIYGPGAKELITSRVGIDTFGFFMHLGGRNLLPLTYVENCADAVIKAGLVAGVEHQVFNVVDDELPQSAAFLHLYKKNVKDFFTLPIPYPLFYFFSYLWEAYSKRSKGQIPLAFNRSRTASMWKGNIYSNQKAKSMLGWQPCVSFNEALSSYFKYLRTRFSVEKSC